jgi:hypothetical protein
MEIHAVVFVISSCSLGIYKTTVLGSILTLFCSALWKTRFSFVAKGFWTAHYAKWLTIVGFPQGEIEICQKQAQKRRLVYTQ